MTTCEHDSLEGDVCEQRGSREDGGDATADVSDKGQNLVVLRVDVRGSSRNVLQIERDTKYNKIRFERVKKEKKKKRTRIKLSVQERC